MKFRAMLADQIIEIEADCEESAQEQAFARIVRDLRPEHITVWETNDEDVWAL